MPSSGLNSDQPQEILVGNQVTGVLGESDCQLGVGSNRQGHHGMAIISAKLEDKALEKPCLGKQRGLSPGRGRRDGDGLCREGWLTLAAGGGSESRNLPYGEREKALPLPHYRTRVCARRHTHTRTHALCSPCLSSGIQAVNSPRHTAESTRSSVGLTMGWLCKAHYRMPEGVHEDKDFQVLAQISSHAHALGSCSGS